MWRQQYRPLTKVTLSPLQRLPIEVWIGHVRKSRYCSLNYLACVFFFFLTLADRFMAPVSNFKTTVRFFCKWWSSLKSERRIKQDRHVRQICDVMNINCGNAKPQNRDVRLHVKVKVRFICITHFKQQSWPKCCTLKVCSTKRKKETTN